jgi:hypothetical protein
MHCWAMSLQLLKIKHKYYSLKNNKF